MIDFIRKTINVIGIAITCFLAALPMILLVSGIVGLLVMLIHVSETAEIAGYEYDNIMQCKGIYSTYDKMLTSYLSDNEISVNEYRHLNQIFSKEEHDKLIRNLKK